VIDKVENLIEQEKYSQALELVKSRLDQDVYNIEYLHLQANIYYKLYEYEKSISTYDMLINLIPNGAEAYAARGLAYHAFGDHKQTLINFTLAIELEPTNGYRYASRAFIKDSLGDHMGALEDYNKAIELDPEDAVSLNNRGLIEEKLGKMHLAKESFAYADKLSGVGRTEYQPINDGNKVSKSRPQGSQLNLRVFVKTFRGLLRSASERKKFIKFLLKR
jgi:tetratricopeptide (TPR) repeat protein